VKRTTVHIFERGQFVDAMSVCRFLKQHGVDAVVVTKHAIQVHPDDVVKSAGVLPTYKWGWDRKEEKEMPKRDGE